LLPGAGLLSPGSFFSLRSGSEEVRMKRRTETTYLVDDTASVSCCDHGPELVSMTCTDYEHGGFSLWITPRKFVLRWLQDAAAKIQNHLEQEEKE
jgi:hypothetical protein